jgi:MFS family permease
MGCAITEIIFAEAGVANSIISEIEAEVEAPREEQPGQQSQAEQPSAPGPLWRNRDYMLLWGGQLVSTIGSTASGIVIPLLILAITNSPAAAGVAGALLMLPYALFSLPAGALIDRWDRKRVMIICDALRALVFAAIPIALAFNALTVWQLYVSAFLEGSLFVFFNLAEVSALPRVVTKDQLPNAAAQNQATFAVAGIIGPSIGTFLFGSVSRMAPFIADAVSYLISVFSLAFIKQDFQRERAPRANSSLRSEISEGVRWLWGQPLLRFLALLGGGLNLVLASNGLQLILLAKDLGAPEAAIGTLFSIGSIGGLAGAMVAAKILKRFGFAVAFIGSIWVTALSYPLLILAPNIVVLGMVAGILFTMIPILSVATFSYRSALVPDELQGRVNSVFRLISWGTQPVGALIGGILLERTGAPNTVLVCTVGWLLIAAFATLNGRVRNMGRVEEVGVTSG